MSVALPDRAAQWSAYWAGGDGDQACLPHVPAAINAALMGFWNGFANGLPHGAQVADLCSGNGAVLRVLHQARGDLVLNGYDYADVRVSGEGFVLTGGVDCAALPLADHTVDAVTSQFGVEYVGAKAAREMARIRRPGGPLAMILHHEDSVLVRHNRQRRDAIAAFIASGLFERARTVASGGMADDIDAIMEGLARHHAGQRVIAEMFRGLHQAVSHGPAGLARIADIAALATNEHARLDAMARAALDAPGMQALADAAAGGAAVNIAPLVVDGHGLMAWTVRTLA